MLYGTWPFPTLKRLMDNRPMKLSIDLNDSQADLLKQTAAKLGVRIEDLARAAVSDLLVAEESEFSEAASRVLEKNRELYERLS
jgi:hypothetical protein